MKKELKTEEVESLPQGTELLIDTNNFSKFYVEDIKLIKLFDRKIMSQQDNIAGIKHLQALINRPAEIPEDFYRHINLAPGSILKKDKEMFMPALINSGFTDAVALSNRDAGWKIILINFNSPISEEERAIILK